MSTPIQVAAILKLDGHTGALRFELESGSCVVVRVAADARLYAKHIRGVTVTGQVPGDECAEIKHLPDPADNTISRHVRVGGWLSFNGVSVGKIRRVYEDGGLILGPSLKEPEA